MPDLSQKKRVNPGNSLTYADAGVNIAAGNTLVHRIKPLVAKTYRDGVIGGLGGFGGLFELPVDRFTNPVMVSGADGVGTKLKLAVELGIHNTVGIDLVAMCVNDILVCGAEPLWFLDYYATGRLDVNQASDVIAGIAEGCVQAGAALLGGETAEMPGMYSGNDYDLAGFAVGIVEKSQIIDGSAVAPGDNIIGLSSSGPHSNGYSLIRKLLSNRDIQAPLGETTVAESVLCPTRIYAKSIAAVLAKHKVHGIAHITGGGLTENIPRILPVNTTAVIDLSRWQMPEVFSWLQTEGNITDDEMLKTFNCGIGMAIVVDESASQSVLQSAIEAGESACVIGHIEQASGEVPIRYI